jgi:hypothetical protein
MREMIPISKRIEITKSEIDLAGVPVKGVGVGAMRLRIRFTKSICFSL